MNQHAARDRAPGRRGLVAATIASVAINYRDYVLRTLVRYRQDCSYFILCGGAMTQARLR